MAGLRQEDIARALLSVLAKNGRMPKCRFCKRPLKTAKSIIEGAGPTCRKRDKMQRKLDIEIPVW
jgi:hypothetical protein